MVDREENEGQGDLLSRSAASEQLHNEHVNHVEQRSLDTQPLDEETLEQSVAYYEDFCRAKAEGPQLEGLPAEAVENALHDPRTIAVELSTEQGRVVWPLLVPIEYNVEYRPEFFDDHMGNHAGDRAMYFSDPGEIADGGNVKIPQLGAERTPIAYDFQEGHSGEATKGRLQRLTSENGVVLHEHFADMDEAERPRVLHFAAKARPVEANEGPARTDLHAVYSEMVAAGEAELYPQNGTTILQLADIVANREGLADDIWNMYQKQFDELIRDHPSMQEQPRESLLAMLADEQTLSSAYFENGKITGLSFFVQNIEKCDWLDVNYYRKRFPDENVAYFPGIVVDEANEGRGLSLQIIRLFSKVASKANWAPRLVFQCTQLSARYVPRLVELGVNRSGDMRIDDVEPLASYRYEIVEATAAAPTPSSGDAPYTSQAA